MLNLGILQTYACDSLLIPFNDPSRERLSVLDPILLMRSECLHRRWGYLPISLMLPKKNVTHNRRERGNRQESECYRKEQAHPCTGADEARTAALRQKMRSGRMWNTHAQGTNPSADRRTRFGSQKGIVMIPDHDDECMISL